MSGVIAISVKAAQKTGGKNPKQYRQTRNGKVDFYKFIFSLVVMYYHFSFAGDYPEEIFKRGYIAVEFFFLVTGFLYAGSLAKYNNVNNTVIKDSLDFSFKKYKSVFSYHIFACVITFIYTAFLYQWDFNLFVTYLVNDLPNILLIQMFGFDKMEFVRHEWYISAMLIVMFVLTPIIMKNYKLFVRCIAPIVSVFCFGYLYNHYDSINVVKEWTGFAYAGLIRALADICLGCVCYEIYKSGVLQKVGKFGLILIECISVAVTLIYCNNLIKTNLDYVIALVTAVCVTVAFSSETSINILNNKVVYYLGRLSFAIYINHNFIRFMMSKVEWNIGYFPQLLIYTFFVLTVSMLCMLFVDTVSGDKRRKR